MQSITAATEVNVIPTPITSAPGDPGISASPTHFLIKTRMAQPRCTRKQVPGRPGIEFLRPGTLSSVDWGIEHTFSSLTDSSSHLYSSAVLIVLQTGISTEPEFPALRTS
jgi:hypothetical protein